jgi:hypothetical protein
MLIVAVRLAAAIGGGGGAAPASDGPSPHQRLNRPSAKWQRDGAQPLRD